MTHCCCDDDDDDDDKNDNGGGAANAAAAAARFSVSERTAELQREWNDVLLSKRCPPLKGKSPAPWDTHGNVLWHDSGGGGDPDYVSPSDLLHWLKKCEQKEQAKQQQQQHKKSASDGAHSILTPAPDGTAAAAATETTIRELIEILEACQDLSDPSELWRIPLLTVYPVVTTATTTTTTTTPNTTFTTTMQSCDAPESTATYTQQQQDGSSSPSKKLKRMAIGSSSSSSSTSATNTAVTTTTTSYHIQMAVYCHRLLPEATTNCLGVILRALDAGSYVVTVPRIVMPTAATCHHTDSVFASSPYPIVCLDDKDLLLATPTTPPTTSSDTSVTSGNENAGLVQQKKPKKTGDHDDDIPDDEKKPAAKKTIKANDEWMIDANITSKDRDDTRVSAFTTTGLLKLLENCGTDVANFRAEIEPRIMSSTFRMQLMLHQQHAAAWMVQMEHLGGFGINSLLWEEREFLDGGKYYVSTALGQLRLEPPATMKGGLLCDEMGLGKTIEVLGLIVATLPELKREAEAEGKNHSTLIVLPPALVSQWQNEIVKCTGDALTVDYVDYKTGKITRRGNPDGDADIVLTTYKALEQASVAKILNEERWGRIVLDEMQEVRSTTTKIAKTCEKLDCNRRWMLSGTPLFDGIDDLRGELNFLRLEPFSAGSEDGFFKFMISDPWEEHKPQAIETLKVLSSVMLRRSKSMTIKATGAPILGLKPLTVEFVPIQQTISERAIYYFLESIVARVLRSSPVTKGAKSSRRLCLRLLRDLCNSAILLNGGLGASSQLKELNQLLITEARRANTAQELDGAEKKSNVIQPRIPIMSCDEAIVYLAQVQEAARTGNNEVAELTLGFGQGLSKRVRACHSADQKLAESREALQNASAENKKDKSQRAKALWHLALEMVTMGKLTEHLGRVKPKFQSLWSWKSLVSAHPQASQFPVFLQRGWRPSSSLLVNWHRSHPEFFWSHPSSYFLESIPVEAEQKEVALAVALSLVYSGFCDSAEAALQRFQLIEMEKASSTWKAGLLFDSKEEAAAVLQNSAHSNGILVVSASTIPLVEDHILANKAAFDEAKAAYNIHPTDVNQANKNKTKKALDLAKLGLRIVRASNLNHDVGGVVRLLPSHGPYRNGSPNRCQSLYVSCTTTVNNCRRNIAISAATIASEERRMYRLCEVAQKGVGDSVAAMSAFESLQALSKGKPEKTCCCICLDYLGLGDECVGTTATISMTKCGHLYCRGCLHVCMLKSNNCPSCRKVFHPVHDIVYIDPTKTEDQAAFQARSETAKQIVREASQILDESNGLLEPEMWDQLYLAIDEPDGVDDSLDCRVSALPRHFLGHLRACIQGIAVHSLPSDKPSVLDMNNNSLSSKVKALLRDLPREERSVIFSASKATIQHLESVFQSFGIGCRSLFSGQKVECSERAVLEWQSTCSLLNGNTIPCPVLLVQAGAAASGLTLTAACKMFLLEPFLRLSEEQQAYGRCHRHGQTKAVHVKCYYAPVSVESRLLEWRKRAASNGTTTTSAATDVSDLPTKIVYSAMDGDEDGDDFEDEVDEKWSNQTSFLLGVSAAPLTL